MGYALVSAGTVASGVASVTPAFGQATTAGNLLVGWAAGYGSGAVVTNSDGTWSSTGDLGTANIKAFITYKANCLAGETAPTLSMSGATGMFAAFAEFSGGALSAVGDRSTGANGSGTGGATSLPATDAMPGELLVSCVPYLLASAVTCTTSDTYNNGATPTTNLNNDATATTNHYRFAWGVTTGNSVADSDTVTCSVSSTAFTIAIASFMLPAPPRVVSAVPFMSNGRI